MSKTASVPLDIPEYVDTELVSGEHLADEPAFWLAHLLITMGDLSAEAEEYGVPEAAYDAVMERLGDAEQPWLAFRVPFTGGHCALAVYVNFEDWSSVDFTVGHPSWGRLGHLGQCGPEPSGPGLSWPELLTLATQVPPDAAPTDGLLDPARRLLLLLPMLGDAATPLDEALSLVTRALNSCGLAEDAAARLARELLGLDQPARLDEPSWSVKEGNPVPVCGSSYSPRQIPLALGITPAQTAVLAAALRGSGEDRTEPAESYLNQ